MLVFHDLMYNRLDFLLSLPVTGGDFFCAQKNTASFATGGEHPNKKICITKNPQCKGTEFIGNGKTKCVFIILVFVNEF